MSHLLELLGRGVGTDLGDTLDRYYWSPQTRGVQELLAVVKAHPNWPDVQLQLGLARLRGAQLEEAVSHLSQASSITG